jgi:hypothetical protein
MTRLPADLPLALLLIANLILEKSFPKEVTCKGFTSKLSTSL